MRASFWVIAPLLARMGEARVSLPGGCAIGTRPVDFLLMALERLGAEIDIEAGYVVAKAPKGLRRRRDRISQGHGRRHPYRADGGGARAGSTLIRNAAREPEVKDLADCLVKMGARIKGAGTSTIEVHGVARLNGAHHCVLPDRIEAGTYATAVAMTGGDVLLRASAPDLFQAALDALEQAGAEVYADNRGVRVKRNGAGIAPVDITTAPFPGFPTDLQAQFMALMTRAKGRSRITETIFENRFMHVQELAPARRPHPARGRHGDRRRRRAVARRAGDGDRPARLRLARHRRAGGRGRDGRSTASITSIAASRRWSTSSPPAAPTSSGSRADMTASDDRAQTSCAGPRGPRGHFRACAGRLRQARGHDLSAQAAALRARRHALRLGRLERGTRGAGRLGAAVRPRAAASRISA